MVDTVQEALYPVRIVSFFLGLEIFSDGSLNHPRRRLSVLYMSAVWCSYVFVTYAVLNFFTKAYIFVHFIGYFMVLVNLFVAFISIIITVSAHKHFMMCLHKIALVDDTLEELGTAKEYDKMRALATRLLIVWFGLTCVASTGDAMWCVEIYQDIRAIFIPMVMDYSFHVNSLTDMKFMLLLRYIGTRLDKTNDHIVQLSEDEECGLRRARRRSVTRSHPGGAEYRRHVLWTTMHLHSELCRIARDVNWLFGIQMALQMMCYFIVLTGLIYIQFNAMVCLEHTVGTRAVKLFFFTTIWMSIFVVKLISMNHICESVSTKAQRTKEVIHRLTNLTDFAKARDEICQFILQLSLRPLKISGMRLFCFGYDFVYKFFVQILTFIIIMVQMNSNALDTSGLSERSNVSCRM